MDDGVWASRAAMRDDSQRVTRFFRVYSIVCMDILRAFDLVHVCMRCFASHVRPDLHLGTGDLFVTVTVVLRSPNESLCNLQSHCQ